MVGKVLRYLASKHQKNVFPKLKKLNLNYIFSCFLLFDSISLNMLKVWRDRVSMSSACVELSSPFWSVAMEILYPTDIAVYN